MVITTDQLVPGSGEVSGHRRAHAAQSDEADGFFCGHCRVSCADGELLGQYYQIGPGSAV
jgi:hypothetical protein